MDLGRPSPALGWENGEEMPFLERAEGRFEMVLGLALIHHLLVRERIPLGQVVSYFAKFTTKWAVLEWVPPQDPQFQRLAGPNQELYAEFTKELFEDSVLQHFRIIRHATLPGGSRTIYLLEK